MHGLKITEDLAADIRTRVKALDFGAIEKLAKAKEQNGTFDVIISTEMKDRAGEIVRQDGWDLSNYKNNPIVLWGHDYYSLPIGVCMETYNTTYRGVPALGARGVFLSADINPLAQQVRKMYEYGVKSGYNVGCTTSVGFIPKEFDESDRSIITRSELLEFSFVPIPANQGVGPAQGRALTIEEGKTLSLDMMGLVRKGLSFADTLGDVPKNVSEEKASESTAWSKPALKDFTEDVWEDLSDTEKKHIAGHFAYSKENLPESFDDLKLPHHNAKDGAVVWAGVKAAMGALMGARGGVDVDGDKKAVYEHLAEHYRQFDKQPPELKELKAQKEAQPGDSCTMDDGAPGVLTSDPKDPDGPLVCLPQDQDKTFEKGHASQKALVKALNDEQERHSGEVEDALDEFRQKAVVEDQNDPEDGKKAKKDGPAEKMRENFKDLRSALADEHTMHRAKSIACFRDFDPSENKAFDKKPHLKALRDEHDAYEEKGKKAIDEFEEKCMKSVQGEPGEVDDHTDWVTGVLEGNEKAHKKAVTKIAKGMCKEAFGEEDQADEKTVEILKEYLAPHLDPLILNSVIAKVGARISSATREKLGEAHEHLKAATAIVEGLHGALGDSDGEEGRGDGDEKSAPTKAPINQRSRPAGAASGKDNELDAHLFSREVLREITTVATRGLEKMNKGLKDNRHGH